MKALSLWQPWASLIAVGAKRYETRHWSTRYRGPLLIHAAKTMIGYCDMPDELARLIGSLDTVGPGDAPLGAVVASARLTACLPTATLFDLSDQERLCGNFEPGRWAWQLDDVRALPVPWPCTGRQGLFDIPWPPAGLAPIPTLQEATP